MFDFEFYRRSEEFLELFGSQRLCIRIEFMYLILSALMNCKSIPAEDIFYFLARFTMGWNDFTDRWIHSSRTQEPAKR